MMRWVALLISVSLLTSGVSGAEPPQPAPPPSSVSPEEASQGFVSIFDGTTLNGWSGATDGYAAENGLLVCQKKGGNIFTAKQFGDFAFRFEFRLEPGGNNGVSVRGHEIQILDDDAPKHAHLKPCQYHGSIYCCVPAERGHTKPAGQWNTEEITCQGSHWKVVVNDAVVVDVDLNTVPGQEALAKRTTGPLGFKGHGCRVEFRNLRVKEL
jgi:hypothetical protein